MQAISETSLAEETQRRYLNYALSVITARALPDVRDGLKPVQRRILYAMQNELHLRFDAKYSKCARVVGDVMGKFHPHGDSSIYDALVRLAQPFTMSAPLVDGRGNFGSADGDSAAAMRYTEARLQKLASELLSELGKRVVPFRPNYDGTRFEPVVLPARFPHLLVNGSQGIAVGMATSIPPHNLREVIGAAVALIENPDVTLPEITRILKGPDFPTGGQLVCSKRELEAIYETGQGSLKLRAEWKAVEAQGKKGNPTIILTSTPYAVERRVIVEKIADVIISRKLPPLLDVRDESTDVTRVVLELKKDSDPQLVMAYLYKHTPLASNVQVNLTCLVPTSSDDAVPAPRRLSLMEILQQFLDFRMAVVTKRIEFELGELRKRIHILEGFEKIFDVLDETIRIIRRSEGKRDAAEKLMARFELDEEQVDAILELKLYRLAKLEILLIQKELKEKRTEAKRLEKLLASPKARWTLIRTELEDLAEAYGEPRRTKVSANTRDPEFQAEDFIVAEDAIALVTAQGWVKRQREVKDVSATRVREGDRVISAVAGSTRSTIAFFSNFGSCYACRMVDIPASTGHGSPVQTLFKLADGERILCAMGFDPRVLEVPEAEAEPAPPFVVSVTRKGLTSRFSLRAHRDPSTRSGRRFARPAKDDEVIYVGVCPDEAKVAAASHRGHALICEATDITVLAGAGKGVQLMKLAADDYLVGAEVLTAARDSLRLRNDKGTDYDVTTRRYGVVSRGGKGHALFKRGRLSEKVEAPPTVPELGEA